jgi:pimeloyl-ACP methyl ester carboxylesterase
LSEPLVLLHGVTDTPRTWDLIRPLLEERYDVLAPTLLGHHGGPAFTGDATPGAIADQAERDLDAAGIDTAHLVGNSLGGGIALELAARGRARSVVGLAPAGGWADDDPARERVVEFFQTAQDFLVNAAPYADHIASTPEGRARALAFMVENPGHVPADLVADQIRGAADCPIVMPFVKGAIDDGWQGLSGDIDVPVRIVWGTEDKVLPWPGAAARWQELLADADWVILEDVGHLPQLDVPERTADLILEFSGR